MPPHLHSNAQSRHRPPEPLVSLLRLLLNRLEPLLRGPILCQLLVPLHHFAADFCGIRQQGIREPQGSLNGKLGCIAAPIGIIDTLPCTLKSRDRERYAEAEQRGAHGIIHGLFLRSASCCLTLLSSCVHLAGNSWSSVTFFSTSWPFLSSFMALMCRADFGWWGLMSPGGRWCSCFPRWAGALWCSCDARDQDGSERQCQ